MNTVTDKMKQAGNDIAAHLTDASIHKACAGLAGCPELNVDDYPAENRDLIRAYLAEEIDSVTAIYLAMSRVK